jgi:putative tryptophan/tyrosine transport system substrate-binding protein
MRRRDLLAFICGSAAAWPAWAQAPEKQYRIAIIQPAVPNLSRGFFSELSRLGYVEGNNLIVEYANAEGHVDLYGALARQVASHNPDVIVALGEMVEPVKSATSTIPIVAGMGDPLILGLVKNLARPGGNLTGVSIYAGFEIVGKRLEILKEIVPSASRVAVLTTRAQGLDAPWRPKLREYAVKLGISLIEVVLPEATQAEIERAFSELVRQRPDAISLGTEGAFSAHARLIVRLAEENRVPAMYGLPLFNDIGGLMTYAFDREEFVRQLADDVHQILHGVKPGDIPIYQPTRFKLTINLKAAKAIGLTFPANILARADEVIE